LETTDAMLMGGARGGGQRRGAAAPYALALALIVAPRRNVGCAKVPYSNDTLVKV